MANNLRQLRRRSGMNKEEWANFMATKNVPAHLNMSYDDIQSLVQQANALGGDAYTEAVENYEGGDVGDYVAPEDQIDFEYTGYGNQPGTTDIKDVGEYQGQVGDIGEYTPAAGSVGGDGLTDFEQAQKDYYSEEATQEREDAKGSVDYAGGVQAEQGNMYMEGYTDDIRRGDYPEGPEGDEQFNEALVRARHEAGHPNPYNNMEGSQFYLNAAKDFYVGKDVIDRVDPYNLFPHIKANQPDANQATFVGAPLGQNNANVRVVQNADGTTSTVLVNPGEEAVLTQGQEPYVAPEDQESQQYNDFARTGAPSQPTPFGGPLSQLFNPVRNTMQNNPLETFGSLTPRSASMYNVPQALPTSDELN